MECPICTNRFDEDRHRPHILLCHCSKLIHAKLLCQTASTHRPPRILEYQMCAECASKIRPLKCPQCREVAPFVGPDVFQTVPVPREWVQAANRAQVLEVQSDGKNAYIQALAALGASPSLTNAVARRAATGSAQRKGPAEQKLAAEKTYGFFSK